MSDESEFPVHDRPGSINLGNSDPGNSDPGNSEPGNSEPGNSERKLRVLVADDTAANHRVVTSILNRQGYDVVVARNGREALYCVFYGSFDVILMDVQIPFMDGYEVARAIRQSCEEHTPIIAITTHHGEGARKKCVEAGIDACLTRPIDAGRLLETVERFVNGSSRNGRKSNSPPRLAVDPGTNPRDGQRLVDFAGCMRRLGGDLELFQEFAEIFREDTPALLALIQSSADARDATLLSRAAHSLKGLAANFGARCAVEAAKHVEEIVEEESWDDVAAAVDQLRREINRLHEELDQFRRPPVSAPVDDGQGKP